MHQKILLRASHFKHCQTLFTCLDRDSCVVYLHFSKYFEQFKLLTRGEVKHYIVCGHQRTLEHARNHCAAKYCRCIDSKHWEQTTIVFSLKTDKKLEMDEKWKNGKHLSKQWHQKWTKTSHNYCYIFNMVDCGSSLMFPKLVQWRCSNERNCLPSHGIAPIFRRSYCRTSWCLH